jgi:hypothetical protein
MSMKLPAILVLLALFFAGCASQVSFEKPLLPSGAGRMGMMGPDMMGMGAVPQGTLFRPASYGPRLPTQDASITDGGSFRLEAKIIATDLFGATWLQATMFR